MRYLFILIVLLSIGYSCNPVKQVLKDPVKTNEIATEIVRRGYCSNDTTIITQVTDTFFIYYDYIADTLIFDDEFTCAFDTVLQSGTRVSYQNGFLMINEKIRVKNKVITKTIDNYVRDIKFETILKQDVQNLKDSISVLHGQMSMLKSLNKDLQASATKHKIYWISAIVLFVLWTLFRIFKSINLI